MSCPFSDDFFFPITALQFAVLLFYSFDLDYTIFVIYAQESRIRQILQPAETPPFLQELVASPLRFVGGLLALHG